MKIYHCDSCHAEVNDYCHWYNDEKPRNMYELNCIYESNSDTYAGIIICHECIAKLLHKAESEDITSKPLSENKEKWIPVSGIEELPKKAVWVTRKGADYAYVEEIGWDGERNCRTEDGGFRCDNSELKDVVAYMPYSEPEPYKAESKGFIKYPNDMTFLFDGVTDATDETLEQISEEWR